MGLKEMLEAQRAKEQAKKLAPDAQVVPQVVEAKPPAPPVAATVSMKPRIGAKIAPKPQEKKDEKVTAPAPAPSASKSNAVSGSNGSTVQVAQQSEPRRPHENVGRNAIDLAAVGGTNNGAEKLSPEFIDFKKNLDFLSANIDQKDLVGQVIRTILVQLRRNPQFSTNMVDADFDTITRGCRRACLIAARKKTEKREEKAKKRKEDSDFGDFMDKSNFSMDLDS